MDEALACTEVSLQYDNCTSPPRLRMRGCNSLSIPLYNLYDLIPEGCSFANGRTVIQLPERDSRRVQDVRRLKRPLVHKHGLPRAADDPQTLLRQHIIRTRSNQTGSGSPQLSGLPLSDGRRMYRTEGIAGS